jgi:hypothetical protein
MQIGSISSGGPGMSVLNPVHFARTAAPAAVVATPIKASSSATTSTVSASTTTSSEVASKGGGGGQAAPASGGASSTEETLAAAYSTTVGGKQYSGSVEESGGEYTASVSNLAGATASGSSIQSAENNLDMRIDILV